ncbi:MAG: DUF5615 family PIN-like protein [Caldilineales bacterium]|nr:DUF5615 family PIN-like protein [Caldilineales bacterium]MCW5858301.1 DUF5615 family PIN-like protein [Caldilineales bacterium]
MNLLADESVDQQIVARLRQDGHAVLYVAELSPSVGDDVVLQQARASNSLLLTADKDFGELVFRQRLLHSGVILLRLAGLSSERKAVLVSMTLRERTDELVGAFSVISPGAVRIRK